MSRTKLRATFINDCFLTPVLMQCEECTAKAVITGPALCKDHLIAFVESKTKHTIDNYSLCTKDDRVCVAASGGKDSVSLLLILKKLGYSVEALAVDEGIAGYREHALVDLQRICTQNTIPLRIVSFKEEVGKPLDVLAKDNHPCSVCGVFRRYLLNKYSGEYDVIATGHNLDDEAQSVVMNLAKANDSMLFRAQVRTPKMKGFTPRIKPLAFLTEKQILAYSIVQGHNLKYVECPHVPLALRATVRDDLNDTERLEKGLKKRLFEAALHIATTSPAHPLSTCIRCGAPSAHETCRACVLKKQLVGDV